MKVLKFGGTSVANSKNIKKVIDVISMSLENDKDIVVVVSALGGVTDKLLETATLASEGEAVYKKFIKELADQHETAAKSLTESTRRKELLKNVKNNFQELERALEGIYLLKELSPRSLDKILSYGEQLSSLTISEAINDAGLECKHADSRTLIKTDSHFGQAQVDTKKTYDLLEHKFKNRPGLTVMGGFIASNEDGSTTTLGRGGSDYTASLVGAAVNAGVIEIWTDVDGVMSADPRKVIEAFPVQKISYEEAGELAHFGAKVIHPKTMKPARVKNIPIDLKNTFNPDHTGTRISNETHEFKYPIKGISSLGGVVLLRVQSNNGRAISEIAARVFYALAHAEIEILLTTQASHEQSVSIAVHKHQSARAVKVIENSLELEIKAGHILPVSAQQDLSIVAIVGKQMKGVPGISGKLFSTLGDNKINVAAIAQGASELNVSAVISSIDEKTALKAMHEVFFGRRYKTINVFLVGAGLIGSTLIRQINDSGLDIKLLGIANSKKMFFDKSGIKMDGWKKQLDKGKKFDLGAFFDEMKKIDLPNSVFVDCTASESVASSYHKVLEAGIAVVTPNKKASSGLFKDYKNLIDLARENGTAFKYETNVGAGLPVINTLQSLIGSGDEVVKIEAVLSGTLSYIFNTFSSTDQKFSDVVKVAKEKGYTEPDPRDDLNGMDVARKILILAREAGLELELDQVRINPVMSYEYFDVESVDEFMTKIIALDKDFRVKKEKSAKDGKVLRHAAILESGNAEIGLQEVAPDHPFYNLSGSDNIISIHTRRYSETPLVVKGPGAGAEVTASGVFADILSIFK